MTPLKCGTRTPLKKKKLNKNGSWNKEPANYLCVMVLAFPPKRINTPKCPQTISTHKAHACTQAVGAYTPTHACKYPPGRISNPHASKCDVYTVTLQRLTAVVSVLNRQQWRLCLERSLGVPLCWQALKGLTLLHDAALYFKKKGILKVSVTHLQPSLHIDTVCSEIWCHGGEIVISKGRFLEFFCRVRINTKC